MIMGAIIYAVGMFMLLLLVCVGGIIEMMWRDKDCE